MSKKSATENLTERVRAYGLLSKIQGFLAGILLCAFLFSAGSVLRQSTINEDIQQLRLGLIAVFVGISQGYYLGRASKDGSGPIFPFLLGICVALTGFVLFTSRVSFITISLLLGTLTVFLMYTSGIIENHERMEDWIKYCKTASWTGIVIILSIQFVLPVGLRLLNWLVGAPENISELIRLTNSTNLVIGLIVISVLVYVLISYLSGLVERSRV